MNPRIVWIVSAGDEMSGDIPAIGACATLEAARAFLDRWESYPGAPLRLWSFDHSMSDADRYVYHNGMLGAEIRKFEVAQ